MTSNGHPKDVQYGTWTDGPSKTSYGHPSDERSPLGLKRRNPKPLVSYLCFYKQIQ